MSIIKYPHEVVAYVCYEVERQGEGPASVVNMLNGWRYLCATKETNIERVLCRLAGFVDPMSNGASYENTNYRTSSVTIDSQLAGSKPRHIARQMTLLCAEIENYPYFAINSEVCDSHIKRLLDVHPWADGNGRTASLFRNYLKGTLESPTILPYYYGDR